MTGFEVIGPLPKAEMTVMWRRSERGVECSARCEHAFVASTFMPSGLGSPFAVQIAHFDAVEGAFVADFLLRNEQEWAEFRLPNSDVGFVQVREGIPAQTLSLGVTITFEQESEEA